MTRPPRIAPARGMSRIFAAPAAVAGVSAIGLVSALTGDGARDVVSWFALAVPLAVVAWALHRRTS